MLFALDILWLLVMMSVRNLLPLSPSFLPFSRFSPGFFLVLEEILYQTYFSLIRLLQKIVYFQSKTIFFFQLVSGQF